MRYCQTCSGSSARNGRRPSKTASRAASREWDGSAIEARDQRAHGAIARWSQLVPVWKMRTGTGNPLISHLCPTGPSGPSIFLYTRENLLWVFQNPGGPTRTAVSTRNVVNTRPTDARAPLGPLRHGRQQTRARKRAVACVARRMSRVRLLAVAHICPHSRTQVFDSVEGPCEVGK